MTLWTPRWTREEWLGRLRAYRADKGLSEEEIRDRWRKARMPSILSGRPPDDRIMEQGLPLPVGDNVVPMPAFLWRDGVRPEPEEPTELIYRTYRAKIVRNDGGVAFSARVAAIRDDVSFQADTIEGLREAFREALDAYLEMCDETGRAPDPQAE